MENKRRFIVKGDLSGIQNYIFNVKTKGAAKELKKRSLYVSDLSKRLLEKDQIFFKEDNLKVIYNGGGNYFFEITTSKDEQELEKYFESKNAEYLLNDIYPFYAFSAYDESFVKGMQTVNKAMLKKKQQRALALHPFQGQKEVNQNLKGKGINYHYPKNETGGVLDFDHLAERGKGDEKLAALKLDVDHLGQLFQNQSEKDYRYLSEKLNDFFDTELLNLIQQKNISDQIYVVFSGGDDCFLIGCWSAIIELAQEIRTAFKKLSNEIQNKIPNIKNELTFSAGIIIFSPKYPLRQMADEAESFLNQAKREGRNRVTLFGRTIRWSDYKKVLEIKEQLFDLVGKKGESKSLIQRVKSSDIGYASLQRRAQKGIIELPRVWSLKYYLRNVRKENKEEIEKLFDAYSSSLIEEFMNKKAATDPMVFPIAARLTELLIKNEFYGTKTSKSRIEKS